MRIIQGGIVCMLACVLLYAVLLGLAVLRVDRTREYEGSSRFYRALFNSCIALFVKCRRIRIHLSGDEKLPADGSFLLVCNQSSAPAPLIVSYCLKEAELSFVVKPECLEIPIAGPLMHRCCFHSENQKNHQQYLQMLISAANQMSEYGNAIGVFADEKETEQKTVDSLAEKMVIAQTAGVPAAIMNISGMEESGVKRNGSIIDVYLDVLEVIPAKQLGAGQLRGQAEYALRLLRKTADES